jgi:hypothetical protein
MYVQCTIWYDCITIVAVEMQQQIVGVIELCVIAGGIKH